MINLQSAELFQTLNGLKAEKDTPLEYAVIRTLRKMAAWQKYYSEEISDINDDNCAVGKNEKGHDIRLMQTLNTIEKDKDGKETSIPNQVPTYTVEGNKTRKKLLRELDQEEVPKRVEFKIYKVKEQDCSELTAWQKEVLTELGFIDVPEQSKESAMPAE
jgi:hypothetical protein